MSFNRSLIVSLGALGAIALAAPAQAQSCDPEPSVHSSYPTDGAMGVPTNAPVYVYGPTLDADDATITLQDGAGEDVPFEVTSVQGGLLIDAYLGFARNMRHELSVSAGGDAWSSSFVTGTGPASVTGVVAVPDVDVSVIEQDTGSCGVVSAICVIGSVPERMTLEVVVGDEVMSLGGGEPAPAFPASAGRIAGNACIDVRVREPGGFVSDSLRFCGNALDRFELAATDAAPRSCAAYAPEEEEEEDSSEAGGCAMGSSAAVPARAAPCAGALLLGLSALLVARQRRRAR